MDLPVCTLTSSGHSKLLAPAVCLPPHHGPHACARLHVELVFPFPQLAAAQSWRMHHLQVGCHLPSPLKLKWRTVASPRCNQVHRSAGGICVQYGNHAPAGRGPAGRQWRLRAAVGGTSWRGGLAHKALPGRAPGQTGPIQSLKVSSSMTCTKITCPCHPLKVTSQCDE